MSPDHDQAARQLVWMARPGVDATSSSREAATGVSMTPCGDNLINNGGYEDNSSSILSSNWRLGGSNGSRTVRLTSDNNTGDDIDDWMAAPNVYYVKKDGKTNNPQGEYFVWLPNKDQCFNTMPGVIKDLELCPGRPYTIKFKAAAWKNTLVNWVPQASIPTQKSTRLNIEFTFEGAPNNLEYQGQWALPQSSSWSNLNWQECTFTFYYDPSKPLSSVFFTNAANSGDSEVGVAIDDFGIYAEECTACPTDDWFFECGDGKTVDIYGKSIKDLNSSTLLIPNSNSVYQTVVELVYKGSNPGNSTTLKDNNNNTYTAYRISPVGASSNVWVYRALLPKVSSITYVPPSGYQSSVQSIVAYAFRITDVDSQESGTFTHISGYNNIKTLDLKVPVGTDVRNVDIELPISELTNDGRYLLIRATAGGKTAEKIIYGSDPALGGCCLNIVKVTIPDVPAATNTVTLTIDTRNWQNGQGVNGQSYVISGAVKAEAQCPVDCPLAVAYDLNTCAGSNPFNPGNGIAPSYLNNQECGDLDASKIKRLFSVESSCSNNTPFQSGKSVRLMYNHLASWSDNGQKAFAFTVNIPECVEGNLSGWRFWNNAPYKDENGSYNGYPAYYGYRILKNGVEVYQKIDLQTSANGWFQEIHDLQAVNALSYTGGETFTFEVMAYGPTGGGNNVWLVDQFEVYACCASQSVTPDFAIPTKICQDNPALFLADDIGNGTYSWTFSGDAMPNTATGKGPHFITWGSAGTKSVTLTYSNGSCSESITKNITVENCNEIECGLISVTVNKNSDCEESTGILNVDVCESCGTTYPITVYYTYNGVQQQAGPFNSDGNILTGLFAGVYENIYIVDNKGCTSNRVGPVVINAVGVAQTSTQTCDESVCIITDKLESDGKTRTFWIPGLPGLSDPRFKWVENGVFTVNANGTATLTGQMVSVVNPAYGFNVTINLVNRRNWAQWSALGRSYKGCADNNNNNNNYYQNWEYYEIAGTSKLVGFGNYSGTLTITHRPSDFTYGFQIGQGANVFNCDVPGVSAWFFYTGTLNGQQKSGSGDINALGGCGTGINDPSPEIPVLTCPPCQSVACDEDLNPANLGEPEVNCEDVNCNLTFADVYAGTYPEKLTRTWTASCNGKTATCKQEVILFNSNNPDFDVPGEICKDNPVVFEADDIGNGTYSWDFGPGAMPSTATGKGPHFVTWATAGTKTVKLTYSSGPCDQEISKQVIVKECDDIECGLISVTLDHESDCYSSTGVLNVNVCESCGTTYPITVFYTFNGVQQQAGPFNNDGNILTDLPPGIYSEIYIVDSKNCISNFVGPVVITASGVPQTSEETCEETECVITDKLESDGKTRTFWIPGLPNISDPRFKWVTDGRFVVNEDGTAQLTGQIVSVVNPSYGFNVTINLKNRKNWAQWSALGRSYKGCADNDPSNNNYYQEWEYYEIASTSKLVGTGSFSGTLNLSHRPSDLTYGFQIGQGANVFNCDVPGVSAWFFYNGTINGKQKSGSGDINGLGGCGTGVTDPSPEISVLTCPPCKTVECTESLDPANLGYPTENCEDVSCNITYTDSFNGTCPKVLTRTWKATCTNKIATCQQEVIILDTKKPTLNQKPADVTVECSEVPNPPVVTASDNCGATVTYTEVRQDGNCTDNYTLTRTWKATDICGNTDVHTQKITVKDTSNPTFTGFPADMTVECNAVPNPANPGGQDNCDQNVTITYLGETSEAGNCADNYTLTRTWKAEDNCGNTRTKSQKITVRDTTKPVFSNVPADVTVECDNIPTPGNPTASDNCDNNVTITYEGQVRTDGNCPDAYTLTRTWKAEDNCGNTKTATQKITVRDTQKPEFTYVPAAITVECDEVPAPDTPTAEDNCDNNVTITYEGQVRANGNCLDTYTLTRTWKAEDNCGNTKTVTQKITVRDTQDPVFVNFPADITVECHLVPNPATPGGDDNCDLDVTVTYLGESRQDGNCEDRYILIRTWKVEDNCGNTKTASQKITVKDDTAPIVTCPSNITIECSDDFTPAGAGYATSTDNCDPNPTETYTDATINGNCPDNYKIERTWKATDRCGNVSTTCKQTITIEDTTKPIVTCPSNITIECSEDRKSVV